MIGFGSGPSADVKFAREVFSTLGEAGMNDANVAKMADMLSNVPANELSRQERQTLLGVMECMVKDGTLTNSEVDVLNQIISDFTDKSTQGYFYGLNSGPHSKLDFFNPFADRYSDYKLGNLLHNDPDAHSGFGVFAHEHVGGLVNFCNTGDQSFLNSINSALSNVQDNAWSGALQGAFSNADLSNLNATERGELAGMTFMAAADGKITWPEAQSIMNKLNQAQQPDCWFPCPCPKPMPPKEPEWSVEMNGSKANIDLGDYTLEINEKRSEFILTNKETGESSRVWGDPHFDMDNDGKTDVDFWGTMTMNLENGTKITIQTTPWNGNENMTVSSRLVITQGDKAIEVSGMDQNKIGDMEITQSNDGHLKDIFTGDGLDIYENDGKWMVMDGWEMREVTQEDMNTTKGDKSDFDLMEGLQALAAASSISLFSILISSLFSQGFGDQDR